MSRSNAAAAPPVHEHDRPRLRPRPHGLPAARRVSGPVRSQARAYAMPDARLVPSPRPAAYPQPRRRAPQRPQLKLAIGGATIALRVAETALLVSGSRTMDRVVRSRAWIVIVGIGLIGIVAMQVSLLKLNSGIGRAVDTVATLERSNATLKADISKLSSGDRIQSLAGLKGYRMPEPADVTYLRAGDLRSDGFQAARRMRAPDPSITGPAGSVLAAKVSDELTGDAPTAGQTTDAGTGAGIAPATTTPAAGTTAPLAGATTPTTTTLPPAGTTPTTAPVTTGATSAAPATGTAVPAPPVAPAVAQATTSGGVTSP